MKGLGRMRTMNRRLSRTAAFTLGCLGMLLGGAVNAATVTAMTEPFRLSIRHDGIRPSTGDETLTYSGLWDGGDGATVAIAQDGAAIAEGLTGEGERAWSVARNGTYTLTHTTYTNGVAGRVETATFVVTGRDVHFGTADVSVEGYTGVYDGRPHGIGVTVAEGIAGVAKKYATNPSAVFTEEPPTIKNVGSLTVWCEISAPGYITQTNSATVTVAPRPVTLTSKSDTKVYDGTPLTAHEVAVGGDGFVDGEGAAYAFTGEQTTVGTSENTFTYNLNGNTKAGNYEITTVNGTLTVTKASIGGGEGGGEPGEGDVPDGGLSKFDATAMYDGEGHTVDTNALVEAFAAAMIGESAVEYAADDGSAGIGDGGLIPLGGCLESTELRNADTFSSLYTLHPQYSVCSVAAVGRSVFCGRDRTGWPKCAILKSFSCPCCAQKGRAATRLVSAVSSGWDALPLRTDGIFKCSPTEREKN